jgi:hypothetical protein
VAAVAAAALVSAACGMKGAPLPPLRPVPGRIADLTVTRTEQQVELRFTVPDTNTDGTSPAAIDHVEIYRTIVVPGATPPVAASAGRASTPPSGTAASATPPATASARAAAGPTALQLMGDPRNMRGRVLIAPPPSSDAGEPGPAASTSNAAPPAPPGPQPGQAAAFIDRLDGQAANETANIYYVAVPVSPGRRARRGPPTPVLAVPLKPLPPGPSTVEATNDDKDIRLAWTPTRPGERFAVAAVDRTAEAPRVLTATPLDKPEFTAPVEFGVERCFVVRAIEVAGPVSLAGPWSPERCFTPVDRYPPAAPTGLQAVQEGTGITLNWTAVPAPDVGGYIILRGEGTGENMQPLMREPVTGTTYRDLAVQPGATYTYSVYAVDNAPIPNVSQQSNRQTVTVR